MPHAAVRAALATLALTASAAAAPLPGPAIAYATAPGSTSRVCSFTTPICLHDAPRETALATLAALDRAWDVVTGALAFPPPDLDPDTLAFDVFAGEAAAVHLVARDPRSAFDRGRGFAVFDPSLRGCVRDARAIEVVLDATALRIAPAAPAPIVRAQASSIAALVACADPAEATAFQSMPDRAPIEDASLFWSRLDWAYGARPGAIVHATWSLAPTTTPFGAAFFDDEPDVFDVLRTSFRGALTTGSTLADLFLDFAIARAFFGDRDDGLHDPETAALGAAARVPLDWDLPWPKEPKRVLHRRAVFPGGASYVAIGKPPPGARLRAEIEWEQHALFRWAFVKLDAEHRELGRIVIPSTERATEAQMSLVDLDGVASILLVGTNTGDPEYAFDPDDAVWEPHGWLVTLAAE